MCESNESISLFESNEMITATNISVHISQNRRRYCTFDVTKFFLSRIVRNKILDIYLETDRRVTGKTGKWRISGETRLTFLANLLLSVITRFSAVA